MSSLLVIVKISCRLCFTTCMFTNRKFYNPLPDVRSIMDSVDNFITAIKNSLSKGITKNTRFTVKFRSDVFRYLLGSKGEKIFRRKGKKYDQNDFSNSYFPNGWDKYYNKDGECCYIDYPIIMHSYVKFFPVSYNSQLLPCNQDFIELIVVHIVKRRSCCN